MIVRSLPLILLAITIFHARPLWAQTAERVWRDASGLYEVTASLVTSDEKLIVLKDIAGELVILRRDQLSEADQEHLAAGDESKASKTAADPSEPAATELDVVAAKTAAAAKISRWELRQGGEIGGTLIGFGSQTFAVQRRQGAIFINDVELAKLPAAYELILPKIISTIDKRPVKSLSQLEKHLAEAGGGPFNYIANGVQLGLDAGGSVTVPLEMLTQREAELVAPGFARWQAARLDGVSEEDRYATDSRERLILDSYDRLRGPSAAGPLKLKQLELGLLSVNAGITEVWEVTLLPHNPYGYARTVVVPGRDSATAQALALQKFPGWQPGPTRKLSD